MYKFIYASLIITLFIRCHSDDDFQEINGIPNELNTNYTLVFNSDEYTYSDDDYGFNFCDNFSARTIRASKIYNDSLVIYEVLISSLAAVPYPRANSFLVYLYWNRFEVPDMNFYDAFNEVVDGNSDRAFQLNFFVSESSTLGYNNLSRDYLFYFSNLDTNATITSELFIPEADCGPYGHKVGKLLYSYSGYVYNTTRGDSLFIDQYDLELFFPLIL